MMSKKDTHKIESTPDTSTSGPGWNKIPDVKLTPASGTNQYTNDKLEYKSISGGQGLRKDYWDVARDAYGTRHFLSIGTDYDSTAQYKGIFYFADAMHNYYAESNPDERAQTYKPWLKDNEGNKINLSKDDMLTINTHVIELLNETFKKEEEKNRKLQNQVLRCEDTIVAQDSQLTIQKHDLIKYKDSNVVLTLENKLLKQGSMYNKDFILEKEIVNLKKEIEMLSSKRKKIIDEAQKNRKDKNYQEQLFKISTIVLGCILLFGIINYL